MYALLARYPSVHILAGTKYLDYNTYIEGVVFGTFLKLKHY